MQTKTISIIVMIIIFFLDYAGFKFVVAALAQDEGCLR